PHEPRVLRARERRRDVPLPHRRARGGGVIAVGIMSGTSADGMDAAAVDIGFGAGGPRPAVRLLAHIARDHPDGLRYRILAAGSGAPLPAHDIAILHAELGDAYASLAREIVVAVGGNAACVAVHGQTIAHFPAEHATLQVGDAAARGRVDRAALAKALAHPYFARGGPKSTGREEFGAPFAQQLLGDVRAGGGALDDAIATATALTVETVGRALDDGPWRELLVAGGGARNVTLVRWL